MTAMPYDVHARLEDPMGVLAIALGQWEARDDTRAQPEVRQAASTAMDELDRMLRELHAMRARLVGEIRASDDATAARVDAMLASSHGVTRRPPGGAETGHLAVRGGSPRHCRSEPKRRVAAVAANRVSAGQRLSRFRDTSGAVRYTSVFRSARRPLAPGPHGAPDPACPARTACFAELSQVSAVPAVFRGVPRVPPKRVSAGRGTVLTSEHIWEPGGTWPGGQLATGPR